MAQLLAGIIQNRQVSFRLGKLIAIEGQEMRLQVTGRRFHRAPARKQSLTHGVEQLCVSSWDHEDSLDVSWRL